MNALNLRTFRQKPYSSTAKLSGFVTNAIEDALRSQGFSVDQWQSDLKTISYCPGLGMGRYFSFAALIADAVMPDKLLIQGNVFLGKNGNVTEICVDAYSKLLAGSVNNKLLSAKFAPFFSADEIASFDIKTFSESAETIGDFKFTFDGFATKTATNAFEDFGREFSGTLSQVLEH